MDAGCLNWQTQAETYGNCGSDLTSLTRFELGKDLCKAAEWCRLCVVWLYRDWNSFPWPDEPGGAKGA